MIVTARPRPHNKTPLKMADGSAISLSPCVHNQLQIAVVEEFGPRFAPGASLLYVANPASKHVVFDAQELAKLSFPVIRHDQLPDIILHLPERNWLFLIETVNSHGPFTPKRHYEIEATLKGCPSWRSYIMAYLNLNGFPKNAGNNPCEPPDMISAMPH